MKTTAARVHKVELYNYWTKGARFPKNGYYVAAYEDGRRVETIANHGTNEDAARDHAARLNA